MKTRTAATTFASAAALMLAFAPANASSSTTTQSDAFSSGTGISSSDKRVPAAMPSLPLPSAKARASQRAAAGVADVDPIARYFVRGYQTLYDPEFNDIAADVDVTRDENDYCSILSNMNVNGTDRDDPAFSYAGEAYPTDEDGPYGGPLMPPTYGSGTYTFGPHYFVGSGADERCFTEDDDFDGVVSQTRSNPVRIRYQSKGIVQLSKSGSKVKVHVLAQRYDYRGKYVGLRSVKVQYRKPGTTTWSTKKTMSLDVTGRGDYSFTSKTKYYYRMAIALTDNVQSSYSAPKYL